MKAILKYPGAKWKVADWVIEHFPEHKVYCEPFFGSGAVFFRKQPVYIETVNDIDNQIVNLFLACRDYPEELARAVNLTPFARTEFDECYDTHVEDPVERARRILVRFHQSFGTSNSTKSTWRNVKTSGGPRPETVWGYLPESIIECCERLKQAQIENIDAIELIEQYDREDILIYCDPPYLQSIRKKCMYAHEMSEEDHKRLLEALLRSKSKVVLSGYDNDLYNETLVGWRTDEIPTTVQLGKHRTEKLWMNF